MQKRIFPAVMAMISPRSYKVLELLLSIYSNHEQLILLGQYLYDLQ
jgi:hypothetical protein